MVVFFIALLLLIDLDLAFTQCSNDCCYWYSTVPGNLTCNPQGQPRAVTLQCEIVTPSVVGVSVRWYRSQVPELVSSRGELVRTVVFDSSIPRTPLQDRSSPFSGLFVVGATLRLESFTSSDNGYYWCQIEVNSTCLQPSPTGLITFSSTSRNNCSSVSIVSTNIGQRPICADKMPNHTTTLTMSPTMTAALTMTATPSMTPVPCFGAITDNPPYFDHCAIGIVSAGSLVVVVLLCCLLVVLPTCICVRKRKRRKMEVGTAKPASSEYKIQSTHTDLADESFSAERNEMELRPANSMQGFHSVSLRVPSTDPLPVEPTDVPLRAIAGKTAHESHKYDVLEDEEIKKREGGGMMVGLNPDNRTNLTHVFNNTEVTDAKRQHDYTNTTLAASKPPDTLQRAKSGGSGGDSRLKDEDGYDTIAREQALDPKHNYDVIVLTDETAKPPGMKPGEHSYALLEDKKKDDGYSTTQPHMLVMPNTTITGVGSSDACSSEHGVVMEADSVDRSLSRGNSVKNSQSLRKDSANPKKRVDPGYDAPWTSHFPIPRRVTHSSSTSNRTAVKTEDLFDDPTYTTTTSGTFDNASCGPTIKATPPLTEKPAGGPMTTHPRTRSLMQAQYNPMRSHHDDYESTADIKTAGGDISEPEPPACEGGDTTSSLPTLKASKRDVYESTSLALFDDPAYDVGLNLKR